jgi:hypothetical protein
MIEAPPGIDTLEAELRDSQGQQGMVKLQADWMRALLAYLRSVETEANMQRADEPSSVD